MREDLWDPQGMGERAEKAAKNVSVTKLEMTWGLDLGKQREGLQAAYLIF